MCRLHFLLFAGFAVSSFGRLIPQEVASENETSNDNEMVENDSEGFLFPDKLMKEIISLLSKEEIDMYFNNDAIRHREGDADPRCSSQSKEKKIYFAAAVEPERTEYIVVNVNDTITPSQIVNVNICDYAQDHQCKTDNSLARYAIEDTIRCCEQRDGVADLLVIPVPKHKLTIKNGKTYYKGTNIVYVKEKPILKKVYISQAKCMCNVTPKALKPNKKQCV